jgi:hypothetical protein
MILAIMKRFIIFHVNFAIYIYYKEPLLCPVKKGCSYVDNKCMTSIECSLLDEFGNCKDGYYIILIFFQSFENNDDVISYTL